VRENKEKEGRSADRGLFIAVPLRFQHPGMPRPKCCLRSHNPPGN
jgi:hypothetical protein